MMALEACSVQPIWHSPDACDTPYLCVPRPGTVQTIDEPIRNAVDIAGRTGDPKVKQVAVWMVGATVGGGWT